MADEKRRKRVKAKKTNSRVTPKGTRPDSARGKYVPPAPEPYKPSSKLVPIFMFGFFGIGVLIILLNYMPGDLLPGTFNKDYYLLGGLGCVCLGFIAATRYR